VCDKDKISKRTLNSRVGERWGTINTKWKVQWLGGLINVTEEMPVSMVRELWSIIITTAINCCIVFEKLLRSVEIITLICTSVCDSWNSCNKFSKCLHLIFEVSNGFIPFPSHRTWRDQAVTCTQQGLVTYRVYSTYRIDPTPRVVHRTVQFSTVLILSRLSLSIRRVHLIIDVTVFAVCDACVSIVRIVL